MTYYPQLAADIATASGADEEYREHFGPAFPEPQCWGERSYEHARGECRHFETTDWAHAFVGDDTEGYCDRCGEFWEAH